jgi:hypothetical protein
LNTAAVTVPRLNAFANLARPHGKTGHGD